MAANNIPWVHFDCAIGDLFLLYRRLLKWQSTALTVPACMSDHQRLVSKVSSPYASSGVGQIPVDEVKVESISLPKIAPVIIPLLDLLPDNIVDNYSSEESILSKEDNDWEKMKKFKVYLGMPREEYKKIISKLLHLKMIKLLPLPQVKVINGIQCVSKIDGKQRLIFDGRPVNFIFKQPDKVLLPDFSLLSDWQVDVDEVVRFGKLDLDNFYHRLGVPGWMTPYLALPAVKGEDFGLAKGMVCPACLTLPMGLAHAVFLAQHAHLFLLRHSKVAPFINIRLGPSMSVWTLVYIDDLILGVKGKSARQVEDRVNALLSDCLKIYDQCKLVINNSKIVYANPEISGLGCCLSAGKKGIFPKEEKARRVVGATRHLLQANSVSMKQVEIILGHWVWFFLLYRPLYSIFFHIYRWLQRYKHCKNQPLWESARREFILAILFLDRCCLVWNRSDSLSLLATDASMRGAGGCVSTLSPFSILDFRESGWTGIARLPISWMPTLSREWRHQEHINVLEFRALLLALKPWLKDQYKVHKNWHIVLDSQVVLGVIQKGRSSAYMLGCLMRRLLSVCLRMNVSLSVSWIASADNPADVLSRVFAPESSPVSFCSTSPDPGTLSLYDSPICEGGV